MSSTASVASETAAARASESSVGSTMLIAKCGARSFQIFALQPCEAFVACGEQVRERIAARGVRDEVAHFLRELRRVHGAERDLAGLRASEGEFGLRGEEEVGELARVLGVRC